VKEIAVIAIVHYHIPLWLDVVHIEEMVLNGCCRSSTALKAAECPGE